MQKTNKINPNKKLSLCMIVKNEEKNISRCLKSVKNIVDEIIVVDTGSTDNTIKIAEKYGAKIFHYEWVNDFSAARNFSIEKASGDWILVLDADEEIPKISYKDLRNKIINQLDNDCYNILIKNLDEFNQVTLENKMVRLFKNLPNIRYENKIHESINQESVDLNNKTFFILHHGYKENEIAKEKVLYRNIPIFESVINDDNSPIKEKINSKFYLGQSYLFLNKLQEAEMYLKDYISDLSKYDGEINFNAYFSLMQMYTDRNNFDEIEEVLGKISSTQAINFGDYHFYKGLLERHKHNYEKSIESFLEARDRFVNSGYESQLYIIDTTRHDLSLYYLCDLYMLTSKHELFYNFVSKIINNIKNAKIKYLILDLINTSLNKIKSNEISKKLIYIKNKMEKDLPKLKPLEKINPNKKFSLCMIVKNEEKNIARCLNSVKDVVDEMIVVDTGSTDNTIKIAEEMGAKIYHFDWIDDFSAARNYSIEQATGDWILILDADEELAPESKNKIRTLLVDFDFDVCFQLRIKNLNKDKKVTLKNYMVRMFNNSPTIRYESKIHEFINIPSICISDESISIIHHGYADAEFVNEKQKNRNIPILENIINDPNTSELSKIMPNFYVGIAYISLGGIEKVEKGINCLNNVIKTSLKTNNYSIIAEAYISLISYYYGKEDLDTCKNLISEAEKIQNVLDNAEFWFFKGVIAAEEKDFDKSLIYQIKSLELRNDLSTSSFVQILSPQNHMTNLYNICLVSVELNKLDIFENHVNDLLQRLDNSEGHMLIKNIVASLYVRINEFDKAVKIYESIIDNSEYIANESLKIAITALSNLYIKLNRFADSIKTQAKIHKPENVKENWYNLVEILNNDRDYFNAEKAYDAIIKLIPNEPETYLKRAIVKISQSNKLGAIEDLDLAYKKADLINVKESIIEILLDLGCIDKVSKYLKDLLVNNQDNYRLNLLNIRVLYRLNLLNIRVLIMSKQYEIAEEKLLSLLNRDNLDVYTQLINLYLFQEKFNEANTIIDKYLEYNPINTEIEYYKNLIAI